MNDVKDPLAIEGTNLRLPRPLWKLKEELVEHLKHEPKRGSQEWNNWASKRVGLAMWIDVAESPLNRVKNFKLPIV